MLSLSPTFLKNYSHLISQKRRRRQPHCRLTPILEEPQRIFAHTWYFWKIISSTYSTSGKSRQTILKAKECSFKIIQGHWFW